VSTKACEKGTEIKNALINFKVAKIRISSMGKFSVRRAIGSILVSFTGPG